MRTIRLTESILVVCLCLLIASMAFAVKPDRPPKPEPDPEPAAYITYHGYAILENGYNIVSDRQDPYKDPYVDRELVSVKGNPNNKRGDKILFQLEYDGTDGYNLRFFRCFIGKPELPWRSPRRVKLSNVVMDDGNKGDDYCNNSTVADMLRYTVEGFNQVPPVPRDLADGSMHLTVAKGWWYEEAQVLDDVICWATFLVDESCEGEEIDPNAITQPNLWSLDGNAPRYWTSLEGSAMGGGEEDPHGHIGFFLFENQLNFTPIGHEMQGTLNVPITWEVTPNAPSGAINVRDISSYVGTAAYPNDVEDPPVPFDEESAKQIWKDTSLSFKLIVSRDIDFPMDGSQAPRRDATLTSTWGAVKIK